MRFVYAIVPGCGRCIEATSVNQIVTDGHRIAPEPSQGSDKPAAGTFVGCTCSGLGRIVHHTRLLVVPLLAAAALHNMSEHRDTGGKLRRYERLNTAPTLPRGRGRCFEGKEFKLGGRP